MLDQVRAFRAVVDALPDRAEIDGTLRAEVKYIEHPPEPPPRHGELIAQILGLLQNNRLSPPQAAELEREYFGNAHVDPA